MIDTLQKLILSSKKSNKKIAVADCFQLVIGLWYFQHLHSFMATNNTQYANIMCKIWPWLTRWLQCRAVNFVKKSWYWCHFDNQYFWARIKVANAYFWRCLKSINYNRSFSPVLHLHFTEKCKVSYKTLVPVILFLPNSTEIFIHYGNQNQNHKPTCN